MIHVMTTPQLLVLLGIAVLFGMSIGMGLLVLATKLKD